MAGRPTLGQQLTMEFISCFIIVFTIQNSGTKFYGAFSIAVSFFIGVFLAAKVSGAHLNPAVSFMAFLNERVENPTAHPQKTLYYMLFQFLGCLLGGLLSDVLGGDTVKPAFSNITFFGAFLSETIFTFFLCLGVSVIADPYSNTDPAMCGMVVAVIIFVTAISIGPFTSAMVNPAIGIALALSSAVVKENQDLDLIFAYLLAPLIGGYGAHLIYIKFIKPAMQTDQIEDQ